MRSTTDRPPVISRDTLRRRAPWPGALAGIAFVVVPLALGGPLSGCSSPEEPELSCRESSPVVSDPRVAQMLYGVYLDHGILTRGATTCVRVSSTVATAEVTISDGQTGEVVGVFEVEASAQATSDRAWRGAGWARATPLPPLEPGVYVVSVEPEILGGSELIGWNHSTAEATLLVRPETAPAPVLLVYPTYTDQAYNEFGGRSCYTEEYATSVSRHRPGETDYYLETYVGGGGRLLALSANEALAMQVRREGEQRVCFQHPWHGPDPVTVDDDPDNDHLAAYEFARLGEPATQLFGTSLFLAMRPAADPGGWRVARSDHWIWTGTGLQDGDEVGEVSHSALLDGTSVAWEDGLPFVTNVELTQTPPDTLILATLPTRDAMPWWCWDDVGHTCYESGTGTIAIRQVGESGVVAIVRERDWLRRLDDPLRRRVTENLLSAFAAPELDPYGGYDPRP